MFCYCLNNPVNMTDESGRFSLSTFLKGASIAIIGLSAIASVVTAGCATPLLLTAITATSGVAAVAIGSSEIVESFTGVNIIKEEVFQGNETEYEITRNAVAKHSDSSTVPFQRRRLYCTSTVNG